MSNLNTEQALENETLRLFATLGWQTTNAFYETFDPATASAARPYLGRNDESDVLLRPRLRDALHALNPTLPP